jgi:small conductance mechanosensitive channel
MRDFFADIDWSGWSETIWTTGVRVILTIVAVYIAVRVIQRLLGPAIRASISTQMVGQPAVEVQKRIDTLSHVAHRTLGVIGVLVVLITVLPEFGINVGALLAGAGIIGIAVGLGAQSLVKDVLSGLFILIENQYGKGDVVHVAGVGGLVEDVNLRRTLLRDQDGALHTVPNGAIAVASNLTRTWSRVNTVVRVSESEDLDRVFAAINRVGDELAKDPAWSDDIIAAPKTLGIEGFSDSGVEVRIVGDTQPNRQWDVTRELRLRLKKAFDTEGIRRGP